MKESGNQMPRGRRLRCLRGGGATRHSGSGQTARLPCAWASRSGIGGAPGGSAGALLGTASAHLSA
eukprot:6031483-Alexandrium_andersonii.AAC.1